MRWIRLNVSFDDSPWLFILSIGSQLAWVKLLCYAKRDGMAGRVKAMQPIIAAKRWGVGEEDITKLLQAAVSDGALVIENGEWVLTNWAHFQGDETAADRQKKFREQRKQVQTKRNERNALRFVTDRNGRCVTAGNAGNGTETETYINNQEATCKSVARGGGEGDFSFPSLPPRKGSLGHDLPAHSLDPTDHANGYRLVHGEWPTRRAAMPVVEIIRDDAECQCWRTHEPGYWSRNDGGASQYTDQIPLLVKRGAAS